MKAESLKSMNNKTRQLFENLNQIKKLVKSVNGASESVLAEITTLVDEVLEQQKEHSESELLRESNSDLYRYIFAKAPIGIIYFDEKGIITACNHTFVEILGSSKKKLIGLEMTELPDKNLVRAVQKVLKGEMSRFKGQYKAVTSGKTVPVRATFHPMKKSGENCTGGIGIIEDMTNRTIAERELLKFKLGVERASSIVFITDIEGYFQYINPAFQEVYGYKPEEVAGKTPRILKSGKQDDEFYQKYWQTILRGDVTEVEVLNKTKDGRLLNILFSSNPIIDTDGNHLGFIAIQNDITERKQMEIQLRKSLKEKEVLLAEIHHRVKNNLAIISGLLELELYQNEGKTTIDFIKSSQLRIKSIAKIHEMLYQSDTFSHISFKEYIEELISIIQSTILMNGFKPEFEMNIDDISLNINQAIPCGLILNELIYNALKHAFPGREKGVVKVSCTSQDDHIVLSVADEGIGVSDDFDFQDTKTLGITLVKILSQQLHADISIGNSDKGFTCSIIFERKDVKGPASTFM